MRHILKMRELKLDWEVGICFVAKLIAELWMTADGDPTKLRHQVIQGFGQAAFMCVPIGSLIKKKKSIISSSCAKAEVTTTHHTHHRPVEGNTPQVLLPQLYPIKR